MLKRLFFGLVLVVTLSSPLVAFAENTTPSLDEEMTTTSTIDNLPLVNDGAYCDSRTLGTSKDGGSVVLEAVWAAKKYTCAAGYYFNASVFGCSACPKGSYCPGFFEVEYNKKNHGEEACPENYVSDIKAKSENDCYTISHVECSKKNPYTYGHGVAVYSNTDITCKKYFGNESKCVLTEEDQDACTIVRLDCEEGFEEREIDGERRCIESAVECPAGQYLAKGQRTCDVCTEDSYCPGGKYDIFAEEDQGINKCDDSLKAPAGARSENDCGIILRIDGDALYMHADKRGPSLVVDVNGKLWYADATPVKDGEETIYTNTNKKLHVLINGNEYTVHTAIYK